MQSIEVSFLNREQGKARAERIRGANRRHPPPPCPSKNSQFSEEKGKVNRQCQRSGDSTVFRRIEAGYWSSEEITTQAKAVGKPPR